MFVPFSAGMGASVHDMAMARYGGCGCGCGLWFCLGLEGWVTVHSSYLFSKARGGGGGVLVLVCVYG